MFDGIGTLVLKDSKVDLFMPQCKYFTNLFPYIIHVYISLMLHVEGEGNKHW